MLAFAHNYSIGKSLWRGTASGQTRLLLVSRDVLIQLLEHRGLTGVSRGLHLLVLRSLLLRREKGHLWLSAVLGRGGYYLFVLAARVISTTAPVIVGRGRLRADRWRHLVGSSLRGALRFLSRNNRCASRGGSGLHQ